MSKKHWPKTGGNGQQAMDRPNGRVDDGQRKVSGAVQVSGAITVTTSSADREAARQSVERAEGRENEREQRKHRLDVATLIIAALTLGAGVAYAGLTYSQLKLTKSLFINDERPYVLPARADIMTGPDGQKYVNVGWDNYGKSPALDAMTWGQAFYGVNAKEQAEAHLKTVDLSLDTVPSVSVVPPGIPPPDRPAMFMSVRLSPDLLALYLNQSRKIAVATRVTYKDLSGNQYYSDSCWALLYTGAFENCGAAGNGMK